jgi:hypothetical protein
VADWPEEIGFQARSFAELANASPVPVSEMGRLCADLSRYYRALGIAILLDEADPDGFFHWLIQSALTHKFFLDRCRVENKPNAPYRKASFLEPLADALAANQWKLAREIAALSPQQWQQGDEYEDDFAYARILGLLADPGAPDLAGLQAALAQLERALEKAPSVRLDLCRALLARDAAAFGPAFEALLADHERAMEELSHSTHSTEAWFEPNRRIMVEGLAVLRLAEALQLPTEPDYRLCPRLARGTDFAPFVPLAWPGIGLGA